MILDNFLDEKKIRCVFYFVQLAPSQLPPDRSLYRTKRTTLFCENICCLEVSFAVLGSVILLYARVIAVSARQP